MKKQNKNCQSCGIPLNRDPKNGGTETDGSKSGLYCSFCYQNGAFTFIGSVDEMQEHCRKMMIEGGHNRFTAWLFSRGLKRLGRWKE
ncbi:MAG TPA: zinc ribbon domain-containing protein [Paludibacter sp.]|nr:zinc ribbon domain-containing protein [Paludibacter sp.]